MAIFMAKYFFIIPVLVGGLYFLLYSWQVRKKMIMLSAISLSITILGIFVLNYFYYDPRPFVTIGFDPIVSHIPDNGFPSDHAALTTLIALIMYTFHRKLGFFLFVISLLVSISRIYVGLHHFVDVLAGTLLAILACALSQAMIKHWILSYFEKENKQETIFKSL